MPLEPRKSPRISKDKGQIRILHKTRSLVATVAPRMKNRETRVVR